MMRFLGDYAIYSQLLPQQRNKAHVGTFLFEMQRTLVPFLLFFALLCSQIYAKKSDYIGCSWWWCLFLKVNLSNQISPFAHTPYYRFATPRRSSIKALVT